MKKLEIICAIVLTLALIYAIGSVGAYENGIISSTDFRHQILASLCVFGVCMLVLKFCED